MKNILLILFVLLLCSCSEHKVDTFPEWCEQISGVDLEEKYSPFWTVIFSVSFNGEDIRDDYTKFLNELHISKVGNEKTRMVWREGTELHLISIASFFEMDKQVLLDEWEYEIERAKSFSHTDSGDYCLYGSVASLFDRLYIHTYEFDIFEKKSSEEVHIIETDRVNRLGEARM
jgi:hypothetical protein